MATVDIKAIKELRERTQAGVTDCKKALQEADCDMDKAVDIILKKGKAKSAKRAGKIAAEGEVRADVYLDGRAALLIEVNSETDFAARNDNFQGLVGKAMAAAKASGGDTAFPALDYEGRTLADHASDLTAIIGEKITLRRYHRLSIPEGAGGRCHRYVHMGGKIGVIVALQGDQTAVDHQATKTFAEDVAMHIAAMGPVALRRDDMPADVVAKQREIFEAQLRDDPKPKPEKVWSKIIEGKLNAWFSEVALLEQPSPNPEHGKKTIAKLCEDTAKAAGGKVSIAGFERFELGEGIEKKIDDLQAGVAELLG